MTRKLKAKPKPSKAIAKKANGSDHDSPPKTHNMAARKQIIRSVCKEIVNLEKKIAELNAEKSSLLQKKIKGDLGMKIADFNVTLRVYRLEGEDRNDLFDTMRETFDALGVGGQLNFLDSMRAEAPEPTEHAVHDPAEHKSA